MQSYLDDDSWVDILGRRIVMQKPEAMSLFPPTLGNWFSYLMLFEDGNRIDLTLIPIDEHDKYVTDSDGLLQILLDKDNLIGQLPASTDKVYHVKPLTKEFYDDCCNEFFWVTTYVAKGLWRKEILFASYHFNEIVRPCLLRMLEWKVGIQTNFSLSVGKNYKYLNKYVSEDEWSRLLATYNLSDYECCWESLFRVIELFRDVALFVASKLHFAYPHDDSNSVIQYLNKVQLDSCNE